jgi:hypothetical protein
MHTGRKGPIANEEGTFSIGEADSRIPGSFVEPARLY